MTVSPTTPSDTQATATIEKHCLQAVRVRANMTPSDLAQKSNVGLETILEIEAGNPTGRRTNDSTARLLCAALGVNQWDIVWPNGGYTTNVGRPNTTGPSTGPVNVSKRSMRTCNECFTLTPADTAKCINC